MKAATFEILMPSLTNEKLIHVENAITFAGSIFRKNRDDFKLLYSTNSKDLKLDISGESICINHSDLEKQIIDDLEKKTSRLLLIPFQKKIKRFIKPSILPEDHIIFDSSLPVLTYKNILPADTIKSVVVPLALNEDFMPLVMKTLKFIKTLKNVTLHIVSVLHNSDDYSLNKATQQLSFLNHLFLENNIKHTAEIINSQSGIEFNSEIVLEHISRVNADLVVLYKNSPSEKKSSIINENLFEIIAKSEVPIITFI